MNDRPELRDARRNVGLCLGFVLVAFAVSLGVGPATATEKAADATDTSQTSDVPDLSAPTPRPAPFRLAVGPLSSFRAMTFEGNTRTVAHRPDPYLGVFAHVSGVIWHFDKLDAFLSAELEAGYGLTRSETFHPTSGRAPTTELGLGTARLYLDRRLSDHVLFGVGTGLSATSHTIEPNPVYTGHRYVSADMALRLQWLEMTDSLDLTLEGSLQPVIAVDNSSSGHGEGTAFGVRGGAELAWQPAGPSADRALRNIRLLFRYRYQRFRGQFPVSFLGSRGAVSVDNQHMALLMIGYAAGRQ